MPTFDNDTLLRRTKAQRESPLGKSWHYAYNDRSEVTTARKTFTTDPASTALKGWQSLYSYDAIGNRKSMVATGEAARTTNYTTGTGTTGQLNLYTSVAQPYGGTAYANLLGQTSAANLPVSVNGASAQVQTRDWCKELSATAANPRLNVGVAENGVNQKTGLVLIPPGSITPTYDADGNLTWDGIWTYTWDAESRSCNRVVLCTALILGTGAVWATDAYGDGIKAAREAICGLSGSNAADASLDPDGDFLTNLGEHLAATNPSNADTPNDGIVDVYDHGLGGYWRFSETAGYPYPASTANAVAGLGRPRLRQRRLVWQGHQTRSVPPDCASGTLFTGVYQMAEIRFERGLDQCS